MSASAATWPPPQPGDEALIGDRYRSERLLGRGGMGEVLAVLEPATGKRYALKRLLPSAKPRHKLLMSREFHTLASLEHPHIVRAFDYGMSGGMPYYTMELLLGSDTAELAPLPWMEVVRILRDVASALSLLHARHLVHCDVGARNVWRTPEGVIKLIDFGAMTNFGPTSYLAGTPPYVAPEALRTHVLDQRTDLYSLGALGHFLLTGQHAYPASVLSELEAHWAQGPRVASVSVAELDRADLPRLPEALQHLIDALLAAAPQARPSSAAEVIDRLDDLVPGPRSSATPALEGVLASKAFVGRMHEREQLLRLLQGALSGTGASAAVLGARAIGRSRLLTELAVEARLAGASVISVAGDAERGPLTVAARATRQLLEALPSAAGACAVPYARVLGHLSEEVRRLLGVETEALEQFPQLLGEGRLRLQTALHAFWLELSAQKPVLLLLDDLQSMDEASIALFTTLAREAASRHLLVVAAIRSEDDAVVPSSARPFTARARIIGLSGLAHDESHEMLRSIFGDVEHLARTARHLSRQSEGNPGRLMELCEYLVRDEKIRCSEGSWALPQEVSELAAPSSLVQLDQARLARASADARDLARQLCLPTDALPLELCSALSSLPPERLFAALDELCVVRVLVRSEQGFAFRSEAQRAALVAGLDADAAQRAHAALGEALLGLENASVVQRLTAATHLMRGGDLRRGAEHMHRGLIEVVARVPDEYEAIAPHIEQAYEHLSKLDLDDSERLSFLSLLAWSGYFVDRRYGFRYGDEALACGERVCGMQLARRLAPWLGKKLSLYIALIIASARLRRSAKRRALVPDLKLAITLFVTAVAAMAGLHTLCLAPDKVRSVARAIEPLTALGPDHSTSIVHRFALGCAMSLGDRLSDAGRHWEELLARLEDPRPIRDLSNSLRLYYRAACLYVWGSNEVWRDRSRTLALADRLDRQPVNLYHISADQIRAVYYAQQGNLSEAARYRARVETRALQRGMTWQVEIWGPCSAISSAVRQRDAMALKRASGQLQKLGSESQTFRDYQDIGRACYLNLRGRYAEAAQLLEAVMQRRPPDIVGYANVAASLAQSYSALGRFEDAESVAAPVLARFAPEHLALTGLTLRVQIELALARAGLGRHEQAAVDLERLIDQHTPSAGPLTLGALHDARASVALSAQQEHVARHHVEAMERWYRSTDCPGLIQHCDRIAKRWPKALATGGSLPLPPAMNLLATHSGSVPVTVHQGSHAGLILRLVRATVASEGALYYTDAEGKRQIAQSSSQELPSELHGWIEQRMSAPRTDVTETELAEEQAPSSPNTISLDGKRWHLLLLVSDREATSAVVGALALCLPEASLPQGVLAVLARRLQTGNLDSLLDSQSS
jgi:tetratricopeptide (TPR) repeat protein